MALRWKLRSVLRQSARPMRTTACLGTNGTPAKPSRVSALISRAAQSFVLTLATILASTLVLNAFGAGLSLPFLQPAELNDVAGVRLQVQKPQQGMFLYEKGPASTVFETPMDTRTLDDGTVQVWYLRVDYAQKNPANQLVLCLGEIRNGQWTLPVVHSSPPPWGGVNNIVMTRSRYRSTWGGFNPFQIVPGSRGLEMLYWDQPGPKGKAGGLRAVSSDGKAWRKVPNSVFTDFNDAFTLLRVGDQDLLYQTGLLPWPEKPLPDSLSAYKRIITLRTSTDKMATWTPQNLASPMLSPDANDPVETEFYCFRAFRYGNGYGGLLWKYYTDPARPNEHSRIFRYELAVSQDGLTWQRPYRDTELGYWSYASPFVLGGNLWFATQGAPDTSIAGSTLLKGWKQDRMIAVVGDGSFRTQVFARPTGSLALNADASTGWIEVTPCDSAGKLVPDLKAYRITDVDGSIALPWNAKDLPEKVSLFIKLGGGAKVFGVASDDRVVDTAD